MVEGVGNIVYIFNRRPIVFKKLIMFLKAIFKNSSFMLFASKNFYVHIYIYIYIYIYEFTEKFSVNSYKCNFANPSAGAGREIRSIQ